MTADNPIRQLGKLGQSVWYDYIHRDLLRSGELRRLIREDGLAGVTSNPAIFEQAITGGDAYDPMLQALLRACDEPDPEKLFHSLAVEDIRDAADQLAEVYRASDGVDGMVSLEVSPLLAYDTDATVAEARKLWAEVDRPNLMIKVPGTRQGIRAFETLTASGISVNVTLLFAVDRYLDIGEAYLRALRRRLAEGLEVASIASVASFFVSRVDAAVDPLLEAAGRPELTGRMAIANARIAYAGFQRLFGSGFEDLRAAGARPQRLLWASTGTKNPRFSDVLYVESLVGPHTVNTLPPATYEAFRDHGRPTLTLSGDLDEARRTLADVTAAGVDLGRITTELESQGVQAFAEAFGNLLQALRRKSEAMTA